MAERMTGGTVRAPQVDRVELTIEAQRTLRAGDRRSSFDPHDETSLLLSYLRLVRAARHQRRAPAIELRRADLEILAGHLGSDPATVLERLGALMGASVAQRRALVAMLASGAAVLTLAAGTAAAAGNGNGATITPATTPDQLVSVTDRPADLHDRELTAPVTSTPAPAPTSADPVQPAAVEPASAGAPGASTEGATRATAGVVAETTTAPAAVTAPAEVTAETTIEVAVGEPPVPVAPEPQPGSETEVAVGEPPVPVPPGSSGG